MTDDFESNMVSTSPFHNRNFFLEGGETRHWGGVEYRETPFKSLHSVREETNCDSTGDHSDTQHRDWERKVKRGKSVACDLL